MDRKRARTIMTYFVIEADTRSELVEAAELVMGELGMVCQIT